MFPEAELAGLMLPTITGKAVRTTGPQEAPAVCVNLKLSMRAELATPGPLLVSEMVFTRALYAPVLPVMLPESAGNAVKLAVTNWGVLIVMLVEAAAGLATEPVQLLNA